MRRITAREPMTMPACAPGLMPVDLDFSIDGIVDGTGVGF